MTRILHILDHSLPAQSGYSFRTRALMRAQLERGWHVAGVTSLRHPLPGPATERIDGLTFHRTPVPRRIWPSLAAEVQAIMAMRARIAALVEDFRPDLLHAHSPVLTALAAQGIADRFGLPLIYEIRAFWEDAAVGNGTGREGSARYRLTRALETRAVRRADAVAVICDGLRADLIARGIDGGKIMVSPNGVDLHMFGQPLARDDALARDLGLAPGDAVLGFIGSFYDYEGLDDLIAAMPMLTARVPSARLVLVGGGPMEAALRRAASDSPAASRIHFVGRVPHDAVDRYYSLMDIMVYPRKAMRLTELVTPLKPLEAMAQGKLVAASNVGGHRELIDDGVTGTLFAPDDPAALADALAALLDDRAMWPERRRAARHEVETHRNWSSNIYRYEPVYQRLLSGRSAGRSDRIRKGTAGAG